MREKESKTKLFVNNIIVFGIGGVLDKLIPLIMLPILTYLLPNKSYFGIADVFSISISFGASILALGMYDGMFRIVFDYDSFLQRKKILNTVLLFQLFVSIILICFFLMFKEPLTFFFFQESSPEFQVLTICIGISILMSLISSSLGAPLRFENKRKIFIIINLAATIFGYAFGLFFLVKKHYLFVLPAVLFFSIIFKNIVLLIINRKWFDIDFSSTVFFDIIKIGLPLSPVFIIYWAFAAIDRVAILKYLGFEELGLYSVSGKLAMISSIVYIGFRQGWGYFTFSLIKEKNHTKLISNIFEYLLLLTFISFWGVIPFAEFIFKNLINEEYKSGHIIFYYLFLSPLALMLFQTIASQFTVAKKTIFIPFTLIAGLIFNIGGNYLLIPIFGLEGAAISTSLGYIFSVICCAFLACNKKLLFIEINSILISFISLIGFVCFRAFNYNVLAKFIISAICLLTIVLIYREIILKIFNLIRLNYFLKPTPNRENAN